jgi:hypothetical protein
MAASGHDLGTGGGLAVAADIDTKDKIEFAVHPSGEGRLREANEFHAVAGLHFLLAGHLARFASPAGLFVDDQGKVFHRHPGL